MQRVRVRAVAAAGRPFRVHCVLLSICRWTRIGEAIW